MNDPYGNYSSQYPQQPSNPLMASYGSNYNMQMRKQQTPAEVAGQPQYASGGGTAPGPSANRISISQSGPVRTIRLAGSAGTTGSSYTPLVPDIAPDGQSGYSTQSQHQIHQSQPMMQPSMYNSGFPQQPTPAVPSAPPKVKVPSESTYPKPSKSQDLIKAFASNPDYFEEYIKAQVEAVVSKKIQDSVAPFKAEVGRMINVLTRSNADEVSTLSTKLSEAQSSMDSQAKEIVSLQDKFNVTSSQIKLLESSGVKQNSLEAQSSSLEKVRENLKAEVNLLVNSRLNEEITTFEDKMNKKFEETDKKIKTVEKKTDSVKEFAEEAKTEQQKLLTRVEDIAKLVAELTVAKTPKSENSEEIVNIKQTIGNISKYREDDLKKLESLTTIVEENKKANANKMDTLEKFVISIKEAKEKEVQQYRPQSSFEASAHITEELSRVKGTTENLNYKMETIRYDLQLIKEDIVRQKGSQREYFDKIDKLERRVDALPASLAIRGAMNNTNNFMTNASRTMEQSRAIEDNNILGRFQQEESASKKSGSTQEGPMTFNPHGYNSLEPHRTGQPQHVQQNKGLDFMEELEKEFGNAGIGNFSIIDRVPADQSGMLDDDLFAGNQQPRFTSNLGLNPIDAGLGVSQKGQPTSSGIGKMEPILEKPKEEESSRIGTATPVRTSNPTTQPPLGNILPPSTSSMGSGQIQQQGPRIFPPQPITYQHSGPVVTSSTGYHNQPSTVINPSSYIHSQNQGQGGNSGFGVSQQQPKPQQPQSQQPQPQQPTTSSGFVMPKATFVSGFDNNPPAQQTGGNPVSGSNAPGTSGIQRRPTAGLDTTANNSIMNQSLNTSIRMQKGTLKKLDQSIHDAVAKKSGGSGDDDSEIELNIDDNGFLIDDNGFPILNDKGEPMKLSEEQLQQLKEQGQYEEVEISGMG